MSMEPWFNFSELSLFMFPFDKPCVFEADCEWRGFPRVCNPVQCLTAASLVCTIVCGWKKKKRKRAKKGGGRKETRSLCVERTQQERDFAITWACRRSKLGSSAQSCTLERLTLSTSVWTLGEPTDTHGFCPGDESRRQTGPWILMRRESAS